MADSATEVPLYLDVCVDLDFLEMIAPKVSFFYIYFELEFKFHCRCDRHLYICTNLLLTLQGTRCIEV